MIKISKEEAMEIREKVPSAHISITGRGHKAKRKSYYVEENRNTMFLIRKMRSKQGIDMPRRERRW